MRDYSVLFFECVFVYLAVDLDLLVPGPEADHVRQLRVPGVGDVRGLALLSHVGLGHPLRRGAQDMQGKGTSAAGSYTYFAHRIIQLKVTL